MVNTISGPQFLRDVSVGDYVQTSAGFEKIIGFVHTGNVASRFLKVGHDSGSLLVSGVHRVFTSSGEAILADEIEVGMALASFGGSTIVKSIHQLEVDSIYSPLTSSATILVDGVMASTYAEVPHWICHWGMAPIRWAFSFWNQESAARRVDLNVRPMLVSN